MIVILDGNSIAYRAYHKAPPLTAVDGTPTGAVHLFFTILEKVKNSTKADKIIAVFDSKGETARHKMYPEYKANRDAMPEDLATQLSLIRELLPLAGIEVYAKSGIEADDIIATLASATADKVAIVTKDKDLFQLVNDNIAIYDDQTGALLTEKDTLAKFGVLPKQILSYLSLIGDTSDNIKGVKGVGEKTAQKLISEYGSLDGVYEHIDEQKGKLKENLIADKEAAYLAMELIRLQDVELFTPAVGRDDDLLKSRLDALGMRTISQKFFSADTSTPPMINATHHNQKPCLMGAVTVPTIFIALDGDIWVSDGEHYESFKGDIHATNESTIYYDVKELSKHVTIQNKLKAKDYMLISWLCEPDLGTVRRSKTEPMEEFIPRLLAIIPALDKRLNELALEDVYYNVELKIAYILANMELLGIRIAPDNVRLTANALKRELGVISTRILTRAGKDININSPKQLAEYLYDDLNITPISKNNRSTAEDVIKELMPANPEHADVFSDILAYRECAKLLSTYTEPLLSAIADDGRIHTTFKQTGTGTGRLSSAAPNLQNIPTRTEAGKQIRTAFIPADGFVFVSLDYSQIELRLLAHFSGDAMLRDSFINKMDIHTITAMKVLNIDKDAVTPNARRLAKAVNFGIIYGLSAFGLARDTGITPREAKNFIEAYFALYSSVESYINNTIDDVRRNGYCTTILGRKRFFHDINSRNGLNRSRAERAATNAPLQGSAADIIKVAMINSEPLVQQYNAKLCLQIHDELIFEVPESAVDSFIPAAKEIMENAVKLDIPLEVNLNSGRSWGEL